MKGEVEVTFKCEGCGTTLLVSKHNRPETAVVDIHDTVTIDDITCPNCAKLHYGPLTEEMVAEALCMAEGNSFSFSSSNIARFLIRFLKKWDATDEISRRQCYADDWYSILLDLARQK